MHIKDIFYYLFMGYLILWGCILALYIYAYIYVHTGRLYKRIRGQ